MADSNCSSGKMALNPRHPKKKQQHRKIASSPDASLELNELCDELVEEILVRLPTKSAVKFKVVCKKWYALISSPSFISRFIHMRRHRHVESSIVLQFKYTHSCGVADHSDLQIISGGSSLLHNLYGEGSFQLSYLPCPPIDLRLVGSSADLLLCSYLNPTSKVTIYYVCNLLTTQWTALPPPPSDQAFLDSVSIGFLSSDNSYHPKFMVVRLSSDCGRLISQFRVQLFSSEDCKWRIFYVSSCLPLAPHTNDSSLVAYRGMMHWVNTYSNCIMVYDPCNNPRKFSHIIQLPIQSHTAFLLYIRGCFGVTQGHLRATVIPTVDEEDPILDVWELHDYDSGLWNLVYKIHLGNLIQNKSESDPPSVLSFHPENKDVIYLHINNGAVLFNMKSRIIEGVYRLNEKAKFWFLNAFHLADQWWPTAVSSLH